MNHYAMTQHARFNKPRHTMTEAQRHRAMVDPSSVRPSRTDPQNYVPIVRYKGPTKQAKILSEDEIAIFRAFVMGQHSHPEAADVVVQLSFRAGLRASEIAQFTLSSVLGATGQILKTMTVFGATTKNSRSRDIPIHPDLARAIKAFMKAYPGMPFIALSPRAEVAPVTPNALTVWFHRQYQACGFAGCSSHTGRRTFITRLAQLAGKFDASLRDVQLIAGHARLDTTERYIEPSGNAYKLVSGLGVRSEDLPQR